MKLVAALLLATASAASFATTFFDDFNRADSANLGSDWSFANGSLGITNNQATAPNTNTNLAVVNGYSGNIEDTTVSFDLHFDGPNLQYAAAVIGYNNASQNAFVKLQNNNSGTGFDRAYFYYGNNGSGTVVDLTSQFTSARITVDAIGSIVRLNIDTDFDGNSDQFYTRNYGSLTFGTGAGLGIFGNAKVDNYGINAVPEPATMIALGGLALAALRRKKK